MTNGYERIYDIELENRQNGLHFFDADTKRFFGSRIGKEVYGGCYFITSEHAGFSDTTRRYTVRMALPDGKIETIGEFCEHATRASALHVIRGLCAAGFCWTGF